jgi:hypothetical protein
MVVFVGGVSVTAWATASAGELTHPFAAFWSLRLAAAFLVGLFVCEAVAGRVTRIGRLEEASAPPSRPRGSR